MALPEPEPGLVIRYAFLWGREAARGQEEGSKDRPCAVVLAAKKEGEQTQVVVAPITHTDPGKIPSVEIPAETKQRLGLDHERSWIITNEVNVFEWPGPDVRPVPYERASAERRFSYGMLPPKTITAVKQGVLEQRRMRQLSTVKRDENPPQTPPDSGANPLPARPAQDFWKRGESERPTPSPDQGPDRPRKPKR